MKKCGVAGCDRPYRQIGYCAAHAKRVRKHGDPLHGGPLRPYASRQSKYASGARFGELELTAKAGTGDHWKCRCDCGATLTVMIGNLTNGHVVHCGDLNAHSELRSGISYKMAHKRVATRRGSAKRYECIDCKQPAEEWSYRGGAPDELIGESNRARNLPYSPTPSYYDPRCKACHTAYDSN